MSETTARRSPRIAYAVILAALIIGAAVFVWYGLVLPLQPSGPTATTATFGTVPGVELRLADNASAFKVGQSLNITISLFTTLPATNSVPAAKDWPFKGVPVALWYPCYFDTPAYAVVLKGNYSLQELQRVANVTISFMCAEGASIDHVVFQPKSSQANLTGSGFGPIPGPYQLSLNFTTNGYWDLLNNSKQLNPPIIGQQSPTRPPIATPFVPGVYTLAVSDEWGQAAVLHFTVKS